MKKMDQIKNQKYRTYFAELKKNYQETETSRALETSCSYYNYFLKRNWSKTEKIIKLSLWSRKINVVLAFDMIIFFA